MTATATEPRFVLKQTSLWHKDTGRIVFAWNQACEKGDVTLVWYPPGGSSATRFGIEWRMEGTVAPTIHEQVLEKDLFMTVGRTTGRAIWNRLIACNWQEQENWDFK